jgi:hypothetical protein
MAYISIDGHLRRKAEKKIILSFSLHCKARKNGKYADPCPPIGSDLCNRNATHLRIFLKTSVSLVVLHTISPNKYTVYVYIGIRLLALDINAASQKSQNYGFNSSSSLHANKSYNRGSPGF